MRIGIDFDNTIACYDGVFHAAALERALIPADLAPSKNSVRDYLNGCGRNDDFTELQGYVYGSRMDMVALYPGVKAFVAAAREADHQIMVVSHKTRHPILGPRHDMHAAAQGYLRAQGLIDAQTGFVAGDVYFEITKADKIARARALGCDAFIDDLPEILDGMIAEIGPQLRAVLFDPNAHHAGIDRFERHPSWHSIAAALLGRSLPAAAA